MNEDNTFGALMNPGEATNFFEVAGLPEFDPGAKTTYSRTNALWLAEFSRLIYRQESDEIPQPAGFITRSQFLAAKGWRQDAFFNQGGTQAGVFVNDRVPCGALVFRGTLGLKDAITDVDLLPVRWEGGGWVHGGFKKALDLVWQDCLKPRLSRVDFPIFLTGHSLGAALGTLAAARILQDADLENCRPAALYTFGSPRVGDQDFGAALQGLFHCRIVNDKDLITTVPPALPIRGTATFHHVGQMHRLELDGQLHIFPPGVDDTETCGLVEGALNFIEGLKGHLAGLRAFKIDPPETLRNHTPVNYTARLEHARL